jgi:hypothetical protein
MAEATVSVVENGGRGLRGPRPLVPTPPPPFREPHPWSVKLSVRGRVRRVASMGLDRPG